MSLRDQLLANKPKLTPITIKGDTYYLRDATVGDMNRIIFDQRQWLIKRAEIEGVALPHEDDDNFETALEAFGTKYSFPRAMAVRLCDEEGNLLFNPDDVDDLTLIAGLDSQVLNDFSEATKVPNSQTADDPN